MTYERETLISNEQHSFWQKKANRLKELERDEIITKISLDDEVLRLEKYEGDVAMRIMPELIRVGNDQSRKINDDIYSYVVRGVYLDPKRRIELYEWIRTVVFKYDEIVIAMQQLDDKKDELMRKALRYAKELETTNEDLLEEVSELRKQADEKPVGDDPVVEIPFENRSSPVLPVKIQEKARGDGIADLSSTIHQMPDKTKKLNEDPVDNSKEPVSNMEEKPDATRYVPERCAIKEKPRVEENEEKSLEVIYYEQLKALDKKGASQSERDAVYAEYRQKKKERDGR